jgi:hypothetical protein
MTQKICSICHQPYEGWGNNAWPINDGHCCNTCNEDWVLLARISDNWTEAAITINRLIGRLLGR